MGTSSGEDAVPASAGKNHVVVGLIADPGATPAQIAQHLDGNLSEGLADELGGETSWEIRVSYEPLPTGSHGHASMFDVGNERMRRYGWDMVVCITDLPIRRGKNPVVAEVSLGRCAAVISLPAFGVMRLLRRVQRVIIQLVAEFTGQGGAEDDQRHRLPGGKPRGNWLTGHFDRVTPDTENVDIRITASRGRQRMLAGMVRSNQPWRVIFGLTGATAGALAFSAFYLFNSNLWEVSDTLGPMRLTLATLASLGILVSWLIIRHGLWESPRHADLPHERYEVRMFNASTVLTLTIGMMCMYVGLLVFLFAAALMLLDSTVLSSYLSSSPGLIDYLNIAWLASSAAGIAGALGASFDSESKVRQAAYSFRERERRNQRHREPEADLEAQAEEAEGADAQDLTEQAEGSNAPQEQS